MNCAQSKQLPLLGRNPLIEKHWFRNHPVQWCKILFEMDPSFRYWILPFLLLLLLLMLLSYAKLLYDSPLVLFAKCKRWNRLRSFAVFHCLLWVGLCPTYFNGRIYFVLDLSHILSLLFSWPCTHSLAVVTFDDALVAKQPFAARGNRLLSIMDVHSSSMKAKWLFWEGLCQTPGGQRDKDVWPSMVGFLYFLFSEIYLHVKWSTHLWKNTTLCLQRDLLVPEFVPPLVFYDKSEIN